MCQYPHASGSTKPCSKRGIGAPGAFQIRLEGGKDTKIQGLKQVCHGRWYVDQLDVRLFGCRGMTCRGIMCTGAQSNSSTPCVLASGCKTLDMSLKMRAMLSAEFHDLLRRRMRKDVCGSANITG